MDNTKKINSVANYIEALSELTLEQNSEKKRLFWFRGEGSADWKTNLVPSSYRVLAETFKEDIDDLFTSDHIKELENNISAEFRRRALPYVMKKDIDITSWNMYFLMQHYKINTRLLDWTENAMIALFFAICDHSDFKNDAKVWILEPFELNRFTTKTILDNGKQCTIIPTGLDYEKPQKLINKNGNIVPAELTRRYLKMDFKHIEKEKESGVFYPLAMYPPLLDERMSSQRACFTVFGNKINGLLSVKNCDDSFINSITIEGGNTKTKMLNELRLLGIDFESVYPDLDGLGNSIRSKYRNEFNDNRETIIHIFKNIENKKDK